MLIEKHKNEHKTQTLGDKWNEDEKLTLKEKKENAIANTWTFSWTLHLN